MTLTYGSLKPFISFAVKSRALKYNKVNVMNLLLQIKKKSKPELSSISRSALQNHNPVRNSILHIFQLVLLDLNTCQPLRDFVFAKMTTRKKK